MKKKRLLSRLVLPLLLLLSVATWAQPAKKVTGKVTDAAGVGMPGVSVLVKGTNNGASTDANGSYSITAADGATLVFSSVGFGTKEALVGAAEVNISLAISTSTNLNEVVVIGYGTAKKKDLTGAITTVGQKDFVKGPIVSPEGLINGKVPGVQITQGSGEPGAGSRIRIRGGTSLNASNDPLIVVDGVPLDNNGISGSPNALALINPNDIESFNILKDASAAAIYGSRAANGVIIITTKKGNKGGKLRVGFSSVNSVAVNRGEVDVLSPSEFTSFVNSRGTASDKALLTAGGSTNWQDEIYRNAFMTDNNINLSGGIKFLPYRFSVGYLNQDGILKDGNLQRTTVSLNLSPRFLDNHLSVNANIKYANSQSKFADGGAIGSAVYFDPTKPILSGKNDYGGYFEWLQSNGLPNTIAPRNPVGLLNQNDNQSNVNRVVGNIQLDYKFHFLPELRANLNVGGDFSKGGGTTFIPEFAASTFNRKGVNNQYEQTKTNKLLEFYLNYAKDLTAIKSRVDLLGGYSYQDWETKSPSFADYSADGVTVQKQPGIDFQTQNTLISFWGRFTYTLMDRYILTATMRRDGSSRFSEDNRWGNFPALAFAWKISEEGFMKNQTLFSDLKLRAGWGITGQQDGISDYGYQPNIFYGDSAARYQFGNQYVIVARPAGFDANLKWEETESRNIGIDMGFAQNRITVNADYYEKNTKDLLASVPAPAGTNFTNELLTNVGSIKNKGFEFAISATAVKKKDFTLDLGYNITYLIQNEITNLQLVNDPTYLGAEVGGTGFNNIQIHSVGYRPFTYFLYKQIYGKDGKPIESLYEDRNRDGIINQNDKYRTKNPDPRIFMGFTANATYKKLSAGFVMRANLQNYMYNAVKANSGILANVSTGQGYLNNAHRDVLYTNFIQRQTWSDYYLENASFVRMDNAFLNYNFGKIINGKANLRISANVQNVFVITNYTGLDPELSGGIDNTIYPRPRTYALGVNLDF
jgi:iron complex outermembrane receptor protein